ncbi:MAG: hypothetical protein VKJ64_08130 [Leptolyngbyaceae bacterium]|nr:hypothetical protein [Leptolyngbyaceae bacterium]
MVNYRFQFQVIWENWQLLLEGVWLTAQLSITATIIGFCAGHRGNEG